MAMAKFPHLQLKRKIDGLYRSKKGGGKKALNSTTKANLDDRQGHGSGLLTNVDRLSGYWAGNLETRINQNLPELPDSEVIPVFLQIDTQDFDVESLKSFGIEIIAEGEEGFIIGASADNFKSLREKINKFIKQEGKYKNKASQLWQINDGTQWRIEQILSDELRAKWGQIQDADQLVVDVGIACYVKIPQQPEREDDDTDEKYQQKIDSWKQKKGKRDIERDNMARKRQTEFEEFVRAYGGELLDGYIDFDDSFSCRIRISGKGLKDIVLNYQYLFEVVEHDPFTITDISTGESDNIDPTLIPPEASSPKVCVVDSGIQEDHRLLAPAIDASSSVSFVPNDTSTADVAGNGGHGTRVAGAVLYPSQIPRSGKYTLPCFIQNAKVLTSISEEARLPENLYPPKLMENIVDRFNGTRIFNMSINSFSPCKVIHMSQWASAIDKLMFKNDILFVLSAGNLGRMSRDSLKPGIKEHLNAGRNYPEYLLENSSRIANPAQSSFALTVGSVCFTKFENDLKESFGAKDDPSSFSRTGLGLWGMIKPDVVEYAGDFAKEKNVNPNLSNETVISPELVKSTYGGGNGVGRDSVGTSYAAPKVAHIAASLQRLYPEESANLYRALIVQSARLPGSVFSNPEIKHVRHYGYGIPDLQRATENSEKRITLIASGDLSAKQAHVYALKVPQQLRRPGEDFDILIEVSLSFMARPRRTRRKTQSYLSTWLDWESSKLNENYDQFVNRVLKGREEPEEIAEDQNSIKWFIRERKDWSKIKDLRRQDSTIQKSWCIIKSYQLPEILSIAVIGHKGWECDLSEKVPYSIAVSFEVLNANINVYEMIRVENEIPLPVEVEQKISIDRR
ncbi:MAG: S8 family peptidase [Candidatus Brocadiaceae bacterium]